MSSANPAQKRRFSTDRKVVLLILLFFILLIAGLFYWLGLSAWEVRLAGIQTTGIAYADANGNCDSDTSTFTFEFEDTSGEIHHVDHDSSCTNAINDGDHVTIWYMADNPNNMLADSEAFFMYILTGMGALFELSLLIVFFVILIGSTKSKGEQALAD